MVSVNHNVVNDNSNNGNNGHNVINDNDLWAKRRAEWSTPDSLLGSNDAGVTAEFVQVKVTGRLQALANQVAKMAAVSSNPNYIAVV